MRRKILGLLAWQGGDQNLMVVSLPTAAPMRAPSPPVRSPPTAPIAIPVPMPLPQSRDSSSDPGDPEKRLPLYATFTTEIHHRRRPIPAFRPMLRALGPQENPRPCDVQCEIFGGEPLDIACP